MYTSIEQIKEANRKAGKHFFDPEAIDFFHSTIYPTIYQGQYFITEEYYDEDSAIKYRVRKACKDGSIDTIGSPYMSFTTAEQVVKELQEEK